MNKKKKIIGIGLIVTSLLIGFFIFYKIVESNKLRKHQQEISNHYNSSMKAVKDATVFQLEKNKYKKVGTIYQGAFVELEDIQDEYYQIKSTNYYVFYRDLIPAEQKISFPLSPYLLWNENIETKSPTVLYQNQEKQYELDRSIEVPLVKKEDEFYTVLINNELYQIPCDNVRKTETSQRRVEETLESMSIFYFQNDQTIAIEEYIQHLEKENYTYIQEKELQDFLNGSVLLPKKTTMIVFETETEETVRLIQKYNLTVTYKKDLKNTYEFGDRQVTKGSKLFWYKVDTNTTQARFYDMLNGIQEIKQKAQEIAVLNYHFFYDQNTESCNESICLEKRKFREQLQFLKDNNFKTLTMQELNDWLDGKIELPSKSVLITIDDGAMGTDTHLPELLNEYDFNATLFLISGWWPLSKYTVGNLEIQSHGHELHHNNFCKNGKCGVKGLLLSEEEIISDLEISKQTIGSPIAFCYPFYAYNKTFVNAVKKEFSLAFIGGNKKMIRGGDKYKIPRYVIYKNTSLESFQKMVMP